ncbi:hypothetical protein SOVF_134380 [Spinacia oleracea]|nr:hypothetical protein SOVF_134380 [Spinacia oleracea]
MNSEIAALQDENYSLKSQIYNINSIAFASIQTGVPIPQCLEQFNDTPFVDEIIYVLLPHYFQVLANMPEYDGLADPTYHVAVYKVLMMGVPIPENKWEACMCRGFGSTLRGPAVRWIANLPKGSITSFAHLVNSFYGQFFNLFSANKAGSK